MSEQAAVPARISSAGDTILDGLFTGMIGAVVVAVWFLVLDAIAGHALYTPALLGAVLLNVGHGVPETVLISPVPIAAYTAVHFAAFVAVGIVFAYLMNLFERFPIMFFVLLVLFLCLEAGFFALDAGLRTGMMVRLRPWTVLVANLLAATAMAWYQWRRHPSVLGRIESLWEDPAKH
jgi:hypothetical protein